MKTLPLEAVRTDGGTQPRAELSEELIEEYAAALVEGAAFPPVVVFHSGEDHWLADGFHRLEAHRRAGCLDIAADVRKGTLREAVLFSAGANADHGLRRTNEDKRRAVEKLLGDEEWAAWSDNEIARRCAVSQPFTSKLRSELSNNGYKMDPERRAERNGTIYTINTERIGSTPPAHSGAIPQSEAPPEEQREEAAVAEVFAAVMADARESAGDIPSELVPLRAAEGGYVPVPSIIRDEQTRQVREQARESKPDWAKAQSIHDDLVELADIGLTGEEFKRIILPADLDEALAVIPRVRELLDEIEEVKK